MASPPMSPPPPTGRPAPYYPFGLTMNGRSWQSENYRFGFNGHEIDPEISEQGSVVSFGDYGYSSVLGRRWRVDPLAGGMPTVSPYSYAYGNPILLKDPDGKLPILPFLLKATSAAATDVLLQVAMVYLLDDDVETAEQAFEKVDWGDVAESAAIGAFPFSPPGGKLAKAAAESAGSVAIIAGKKAYAGQDYSAKDAAADFAMGMLAELGAGEATKLLKSKRAREKLTALVGEDNVRKLLGEVPQGGAYGKMPGMAKTGYQKHHMPADAISPISRYKGGAIQISPEDHEKTASFGSTKAAKKYRQEQERLINSGDFNAAFEMDVQDVRSKFGDKYNTAIEQARQYYKKEGLID